MEKVLKKFNYNSLDDIYATVGYGGLTINQVLLPLKEEYNKLHEKPENKDDFELKQYKKSSRERMATLNGVKVSGFKDMAVRFAKCCNPVPGDEIIGYITRGRGVSIHRADCTNIGNLEGTERIVDVSWESDAKANYQAEIQIKAKDQQGLLSNVSNVLAEAKIPITAMNARTTKNGTAYINLTTEVRGAVELEKLLKGFNKIKGVISTHRV